MPSAFRCFLARNKCFTSSFLLQLFSIQSEIAFNECKRKSMNFTYLGWISLVEIFHYRIGDNDMSMQDVCAQIQNRFCQIPERFFNFSL